jgi:hypothetical protein
VATVPSTYDFPTGLFTSTDANARIRDPISFLLNKPAAELRQSVAQTGVVTATFTDVTFTTEDLDAGWATGTGGHDTAVNTARFTAVYPGWYGFAGATAWANNATGQRGSRWALNGAAVNASATLLAAVSGNVTVVPARLKKIPMNVGDYVTLQGYQTSGGNLDMFVSAEFSSSMTVEFIRNL